LITYVGGGLGVCRVNEIVTMTGLGQSGSDEVSFMAVELHSTGGIKFKPFYIEVSFSSIFSEKYKNMNWGGIIFGFGLFF
jgi:hypothetical protein